MCRERPLTGRKQDAGSVVRIPASEIENRVARAVGAHLAGQTNTIDGCRADHGILSMRTRARDGFVKALRDAHRWLDELLIDPTQTIESLAVREGKSERSIRMTLSLAFISPVLAEAAMGGRLPRGFCVKRLTDLPMLWSDQWGVLGLREPIQAQAELA